MRASKSAVGILLWLLSVCCAVFAAGQAPPILNLVTVTVVDENGLAVSGAQIGQQMAEESETHIWTDYAGRGMLVLQKSEPYTLRVQKPGFYESTANVTDPQLREIRVVIRHEQIVEQVSVTASPPGIDTEQTSDRFTMNLPE